MVSQFVTIDLTFIRSQEFKAIRPSTLKVYFYLKSRILRNKENQYYKKGKLVCRLYRKKIQEENGLSLYQVNKAFRQLENEGVKIIRTGRAGYFILGEWQVIKAQNGSGRYVENFFLEDRFYPQKFENETSDSAKIKHQMFENRHIHYNKELLNKEYLNITKSCGKNSFSFKRNQEHEALLLRKLTFWFSTFPNIRSPTRMAEAAIREFGIEAVNQAYTEMTQEYVPSPGRFWERCEEIFRKSNNYQ